MSSIDDHANGAEQTRSHRNPPEECSRVVRLVCRFAHDADDARELCRVLGLNPRDGRREAPTQADPRPAVDTNPSAPPALGSRPALL